MRANGTPVPPIRGLVRTALFSAPLVSIITACSSTPKATVTHPANPHLAHASSSVSAIAYATCMRSHGVPKYPDPDSDGNLPKGNAQGFGVSDTQLQSAQKACQSLLPAAGSLQDQARQCSLTGDCPPALVQQMQSGGRVLARCMRSHGITKWPDPTISVNGSPYFDVSGAGLTRAYTHSAQIQTIANNCGDQHGAVSLPMG